MAIKVNLFQLKADEATDDERRDALRDAGYNVATVIEDGGNKYECARVSGEWWITRLTITVDGTETVLTDGLADNSTFLTVPKPIETALNKEYEKLLKKELGGADIELSDRIRRMEAAVHPQ